MAKPFDGHPEEVMAELVKLGLGFEFVPKRHERDNPGRDPYWAIYINRDEQIGAKTMLKLAQEGFEASGGYFSIERRWPQ